MHILLNWTLQGAVVAVATAGGLRLLRGAPAATRHAVCWAALVAILGLPFVPSVWTVVLTVISAPAATPATAFALPATGAGPSAPLVRLPAVFSATSVLLGAMWMLWTMLQVVRVARDVRGLQRARRRCRVLPAAIEARFSPATKRLLAATGARVVLCDGVRAAAVLGGGQPVIGLQLRLVNALSDSELNAVLVHELAHVMRRDPLATVVQRAVHVLVGWHPGIWWVMRRLALEREMACDEAALAEAGGPKAYATCLTRIAGLAQRPVLSPGLALGMLLASGLRRRIVHVLTPGRFSRRTAGWASRTLSTSLCALAFTMGPIVVFGEPAVAEGVAAFDTAASDLVRPLQDALLPAASVTSLTRQAPDAAAASRRAARTASPRAARPEADALGGLTSTMGEPVARSSDQGGAAATQEPSEPASGPVQGAVLPETTPGVVASSEGVAAPSSPAEGAPLAAAPATRHDRTVTDAAVAAAAGATDAWNATANATAESGVAVGRKTQKGAVATAGAFARLGRRIASSF